MPLQHTHRRYVFEAVHSKEVLVANESDDYGNVCFKGETVIRGVFYDHKQEKKAGSIYRKNRKSALIYPGTVMYVGVALTPEKNDFLLAKELHEDILITITA